MCISPLKGFDEFWATYPRHVAKDHAKRMYAKKILAGHDPERILAGAQRFAQERRGKDPKYTPHPGTWLHDERWEDEPTPQGAWHGERSVIGALDRLEQHLAREEDYPAGEDDLFRLPAR